MLGVVKEMELAAVPVTARVVARYKEVPSQSLKSMYGGVMWLLSDSNLRFIRQRRINLNLIEAVASTNFLMIAALGALAPLGNYHFRGILSALKFLTGQATSAQAVLPQNHVLPSGAIIEQAIN